MRLFIGFHALLALALAAVQRTWLEAIVVIGLSVLLSRLPAQRRPGSFFARAGGGIALQLFAALRVDQVPALPRVAFLSRPAVAMLVIYADWKCLLARWGADCGRDRVDRGLARRWTRDDPLPRKWSCRSVRSWSTGRVSALQFGSIGLWASVAHRHLIAEQRRPAAARPAAARVDASSWPGRSNPSNCSSAARQVLLATQGKMAREDPGASLCRGGAPAGQERLGGHRPSATALHSPARTNSPSRLRSPTRLRARFSR
jgi:hypothetical protein